MRNKSIAFILTLLLLAGLTVPVHAQSGIRISENQATLHFPESVTFNAQIRGATDITAVVLEYGVEQLTCGTVVAEAFPDFAPSASVQVEWTWEMRQSGSLPPGATIWWRWQVTDASGNQYTSPQETVTWLDNLYDWQEITGGNINLHWYSGDQSFGQELHDAAVQALIHLSQDVGLHPEKPIELYIYANTQDMQDAVLYEPAWTGGLTFIKNNIIIIGISPDQIDWGKHTEAHEITHALVGRLTFTCLGFIPTWLNEGLAVYSEGGPDEYEQTLLTEAVTTDTLMSIRSLGGGFPETEHGYLAYAESYSVVDFMIQTYGRNKIDNLLAQLSDGTTADDALMAIYGFNVDGLDDAWRVSIGLDSRGTSNPTPIPTPTTVSTIVPFSGVPAAMSVSTPRPTRVATATPTVSSSTDVVPTPGPVTPAPSLSERLGISHDVLTVIEFSLVCAIISLAALAGPIILTLRRRRRREK